MDKTLPSSAGGMGLMPGQGFKIPHASRPKERNIKQKQCCNKFNKDFKNGSHQKKKKKERKKRRTDLLRDPLAMGCSVSVHLEQCSMGTILSPGFYLSTAQKIHVENFLRSHCL